MSMLRFPALCAVLLLAFANPARATITMEFSKLVNGRIASGFGNAAATTVGTDGMNWGIIVDTSGGNSFASGLYTAFNIGTAGFLSTAGGVTDDYYVPASATTFNSTENTESGGAAGGFGTIGTIANVPFGLGTGINTGQRFALIWFSTNTAVTGAKYGFFTDSTFTIPPDGTLLADRTAPFAGADPIRPADLTIAVPEPSSLLYLAAGTLLLARRRSRR